MLQVTKYFLFLSLFLYSMPHSESSSFVRKGDNERYTVIIVGAGPSGIAAASKLVQNNVSDIIILEARNRIGGRIHTVHDGGVIEKGAQYIHGEEGNAVYQLVKDLDVYERSTDQESIFDLFVAPGKRFDNKIGDKLMDIRHSLVRVEKRPELNGTYENYFISRLVNELHKLNMSSSEINILTNMIDKVEAIHNAGKMNEMGPIGFFDYIELPGDNAIEWKNGYKTLLNILMRKYPNIENDLQIDQKILLNKEVNKVEWGENGGHVYCTDGTAYAGTYIIITLPLGVLKQAPQNFFQPALPDYKLEAIKALGFGTVDKIFLKFEDEWWTNLTQGFVFGMTQDDITHYKSISKYGTAAKEMESLSDNEVMKACHEIIKYLLGDHIPAPKSVIRSKWFSDPYSKGSYSFRSVKSDAKNITGKYLEEPLINSQGKPVILFAGEATHLHFFSTVHGAIETGWREAERVLKNI